MELVNELCDLLQNHANRDKVVCLACYALKLWGSTRRSEPLLTASARLAGARAATRLFDDPAALRAAVAYGLGKHEGPIWGALGVSNAAATLAYLQAEKVAWLIDTGILRVSKDTEFWVKTGHKLFWSLLAFTGFLRSIRALHLAASELNSSRKRKCSPARMMQACLVTTKLCLDTAHAVSWLPHGWLWGGQLSAASASAVATASAVLGIVMHYHGKRLAPAR